MDNEKKVVEVNEKVEKVENEKKLFYFLKLQRDFFQRSEVKILEAFPNGREYAYFYLKLMVESLATNGYLRTVHNIPLNDEMLAAITNTQADVVRSAIIALQKLNMIEIVEGGVYFISEVAKITGTLIDSPEANKKRRQRAEQAEEEARLKGIGSGEGDNMSRLGDNMSRVCPEDVPNVSRECPENDTGTICPENIRSIEVKKIRSLEVIEREEEESSNYSSFDDTRAPTREEVEQFCEDKCEYVNPIAFWNYYEKRNWTVKGEPVVDWRSLLLKWDSELKRDYDSEGMSTEEQVKLGCEYKRKFNRSVPIAFLGRPRMIKVAIASDTPLAEE